jgi:hypothetical protein
MVQVQQRTAVLGGIRTPPAASSLCDLYAKGWRVDYQRIYDQFVADRKVKEALLLKQGGYVESHHIVPRARGGSNAKDNLIFLTASDHIFAHVLLAKIHGGSMWFAANLMLSSVGQRKGTRSNRRVRFAAAQVRAHMPEQTRAVHTGKIFTTESRAKLSAAKKGRNAGELNSFYGKTHDADTRAKLSAAAKKRSISPEHLEAFMAAGKAAKKVSGEDHFWFGKVRGDHSLLMKGSGNPRAKKVVCVDTGVIYSTVTEAARQHGLQTTNLSRVCQGKLKQTGGFRWAYA